MADFDKNLCHDSFLSFILVGLSLPLNPMTTRCAFTPVNGIEIKDVPYVG